MTKRCRQIFKSLIYSINMFRINKINKICRQLSQVKLKMQALIKITQFDKLVKKYLQIVNERENTLGNNPEEFLYAGIVSQIIQPRSQRDFVKELNENPVWDNLAVLMMISLINQMVERSGTI